MVIRAIYPHCRVRPERATTSTTSAGRCSPTTGPTSTTTAGCGPTRTTTASSTTPTRPQTDIDGDPLIDFKHSEIEKGEYVRFTYLRTVNDALQVMVRDPAKRMSSGLFLGLTHPERSLADPDHPLHVRDRLLQERRLVAGSPRRRRRTGSFTAKIHVPTGTPAGMYEGAVVVRRGGQESVVPVAVTVPAKVTQAADGSITGSLKFGGDRRSPTPRRNLTYDNGSVFGANDWSWRAESGDWRFFYFDVPTDVARGHAVPVRHDLERHGARTPISTR